MKKLKGTIVTLAMLLTISMSFTTMLGLVQAQQSADLPIIQPDRSNTSVPLADDLLPTDNLMFEYDYGMNASVSVNRSIEIQTFGVLSMVDSMKLVIIGNVNLTCFNYTLPNINVNNITHSSFRVSNGSIENLQNATSLRSYTYQKKINYTSYMIMLDVNGSRFGEGSVLYIEASLEFAYPYLYWLEGGQQVIQYEELIYPLINNIQITDSKTIIQKQGGDVFLTDRISPTNGTNGIQYSINTDEGFIQWKNITRSPFNYSQSYEDDVYMKVYLTAVAAGGVVPLYNLTSLVAPRDIEVL